MPKQMLVWLLLFPLCVNPVCGLDSDLNGDGIVNAKDVIVLSKEWHQIGTPDGGEDCPWRRFGDSGIYYEGSSVGIGGPPLVDALVAVFGSKGKRSVLLTKSAGDCGSIVGCDAWGNSQAVLGVASSGGGEITLNGPNGEPNLRIGGVSGSLDDGIIGVCDSQGNRQARFYVNSRRAGEIALLGPNGKLNVMLDCFSDNSDHGKISVHDSQGNGLVHLYVGHYGNGLALMNGKNGNANIWLSSTNDGNAGWIEVCDSQGTGRATVTVDTAGGDGVVYLKGPNGKANLLLQGTINNPDHGYVGVYDSQTNAQAQMYVDTSGEGCLTLYGPNCNTNIYLSSLADNNNCGAIGVYDSQGIRRAGVMASSKGVGVITLYGPNDKLNVGLGASSASDDKGYIGVMDQYGNVQGALYVNSAGQGVLSADITKTVLDNSVKKDTNVVYSSLATSEPMICHRGVVRLFEGRGMIELPEHFTANAATGTLTVQLTAGSLESRGVGFEIRDNNRIEVCELNHGVGSYDVHYLIHARRSGFDDFETVVSAMDVRSIYGDPEFSDAASHSFPFSANAADPEEPHRREDSVPQGGLVDISMEK